MTVSSLHHYTLYRYVNVYVTTPAVCDVKRGLPVEGGEGGGVTHQWFLALGPIPREYGMIYRGPGFLAFI
jgi:hypothetical protein